MLDKDITVTALFEKIVKEVHEEPIKPEVPEEASNSEENVIISTDENGNTVSKVLKINNLDGKNSIEVKRTSNNITVEITDLESLRNGKGSLEINSDRATISLPFSLLDRNLLIEGSKVVFKFSISEVDDLTKNVKGVKKVFEFNLAIVNAEDVIEVHDFKDELVEVTLKLTDDELSGLDRSKLAVFYYNEDTKSFEVMDTKVEGNNVTFTTSHFSKFIVAEKDESNNSIGFKGDKILPQTGGRIDMEYMLPLGVVITILGAVIILKKRKVY